MKKSILFLIMFLICQPMVWGEENMDAKKTQGLEKATFAGGCFWCMEPPFENQKGIKDVISGYTGGHVENPTYEEVCSGTTGHAEGVEVTFDPKEISYEKLLDIFWHNVDPTDGGGQFADRGDQYRTEIFYHGEEQKRLAEKSKENLEKAKVFTRPITTKITPAVTFYKAEDYHQDYCRLNPLRYKAYRYGSGRDTFLEKTWGKQQKH